ncbi:MAG: hypothetical protein QNJ29_05515 [Rhizobiaceae bacterium]|nr:hypothetical protein [Rhizobiaceae bacterium]
MASVDESMKELLTIDGAAAVAVVDSDSGMVLGKEGNAFDLDLAAAGNTEVVKAKLNTMKSLGLADSINDILITLSSQYHIITPLPGKATVFMYLVLDKAKSNLALARIKTQDCAAALKI